MGRIASCILFLSLFAASASAAVPEQSRLSAIPPDGFQFGGNWDCEGTFRNAQVHKAVFTGATILGDTWLELTERDTQPSTGYLAKYLIGYDAEHKQIVEFHANNFGAATYASSEGWKNRVLTMTSAVSQDPKAPYAVNRFLYTIADKDTFQVDWQISKATPLNWVQADHLACKRKSGA